MAIVHDISDSIRVYRTGAASHGGAPTGGPSTSLGKHASSFEETSVGIKCENLIPGLLVLYASGECGVGTGLLRATSIKKIQFRPPNGDWGPEVEIANGETKVLLGDSYTKYIRVQRISADDLTSTTNLLLTDEINNWIGQDNVPNSESTSGADQYRCFAFITSPYRPTDFHKFWLKPLGSPATVQSNYGTGAVTISITGDISDWEGFCYVENQNTGEVFYPISRTSNSLTVLAAHRDVYNETGGGSGVGVAGTAGDFLYPIPSLRIAHEAPSSQPSGQLTDKTVAGEGSAPSLTFYHPVSSSDPQVVSVGKLERNYMAGIWVHRKTVAGVNAHAYALNGLKWSFIVN